MVIRSIPRERIFVSEDFIFRLYDERKPQYSDGLKPTQIPDYIVQMLVEMSEQNQRFKESPLSAIPSKS